jgi:hypothetical protein
MEYTENILYFSVYSNIPPQTQGGRFWNLEFENKNKSSVAAETEYGP